jgi:hypothetical protein
VVDQLNLEKKGIPTVTFATTELVGLAKSTAFSMGVADMAFVVIPHPMGGIPLPEITQKSKDAYPLMVKSAIEWKPSATMPPQKPAYPSVTFNFKGTEADVNELFREKGWSLGLPVVPPTSDKVAAMLKGTTRKPSEVIGQLKPRMSSLTVELVAVAGVMAGCKAEHMPVLIAIAEALVDPKANWSGVATATGSVGALIIVNGPIVKELGIAYGQGAASRGHYANASIGYAVNLLAMVPGGSKPPQSKKTTLGSPMDFVAWIFAENEAKLPKGWKTYAEDRGFKRTDSVVTMMGIWPGVNVVDLWSASPEEHSTWFSRSISPLLSVGGPCFSVQLTQPHIIGLGPEHLDMYVKAGYTKDQISKMIWEKARIPFSSWAKGCPEQKVFREKFGEVTPETLVPITLKPEYLQIVIAGGAGQHSHYFAPFLNASPVSKIITK